MSVSQASPVKRDAEGPFHVQQIDDEGKSFAVTQHLDVRGLTCPTPALKSLERGKALQSGEVLEVVGDWPGSKFEVPFAVAEKHGMEVVRIIDSEVPEDETWWIYIRKQ